MAEQLIFFTPVKTNYEIIIPKSTNTIVQILVQNTPNTGHLGNFFPFSSLARLQQGQQGSFSQVQKVNSPKQHIKSSTQTSPQNPK